MIQEREGIGTWKCFDHAVYALPNPGWQLVQHPGFPVYQIVAKKCQMASSIFVSKSYITLRVYVQNMHKHATVPYREHYKTCKINRDIYVLEFCLRPPITLQSDLAYFRCGHAVDIYITTEYGLWSHI